MEFVGVAKELTPSKLTYTIRRIEYTYCLWQICNGTNTHETGKEREREEGSLWQNKMWWKRIYSLHVVTVILSWHKFMTCIFVLIVVFAIKIIPIGSFCSIHFTISFLVFIIILLCCGLHVFTLHFPMSASCETNLFHFVKHS